VRRAIQSRVAAAGIDSGATLLKLALRASISNARDENSPPHLQIFPAEEFESCLEAIRAAGCSRVGLTGGGAPELAERLRARDDVSDEDAFLQVTEFEAWARGAGRLLREHGKTDEAPYLLVSLGTGCSAMRVSPEGTSRVGGTALGGGTILGLGAALLGTQNFSELIRLAARGDRSKIDLMVGDIAGGANIPLPRELNAASFAKLARADAPVKPEPQDLAQAILGMVGENVGMLCSGFAKIAGVGRIVFGGSTLRGNRHLAEMLGFMTLASGLEPVILPNGEFTGALGALEIATASLPD
jgi:type II pantothenate kinase